MQSSLSMKIGVIGLGYVGLPLAVAFGKYFDTLGFDLDSMRITALQIGVDCTGEVTNEEIVASTKLRLSSSAAALKGRNVFVIAVPTPIDTAKRPDLSPLLSATRAVGAVLSPGAVVIYESTVYPGVTEDICAPLLEEVSGLTFNKDFFCGYSPERANPGDHERRLATIVKVTAGSTPETAHFVDGLYKSIVDAGTYRAPSIRVAEAAKVIENTQRDLNIALVNELAIIFNRIGIDTHEVLDAAATKWNFLPFRPGLVGGHCIGVDPYYLTHKAQEVGYHPEVILAGRRINDSMGKHVADQVLRLLVSRKINPIGARLLVLGLTFKENCPDLRNTRVVDLVEELKSFNAVVDVYDPVASFSLADRECGIQLLRSKPQGNYDGVILAVAHQAFIEWRGDGIREQVKPGGVVYDVKGVLPRDVIDARL